LKLYNIRSTVDIASRHIRFSIARRYDLTTSFNNNVNHFRPHDLFDNIKVEVSIERVKAKKK
jgi:hypothetical protein